MRFVLGGCVDYWWIGTTRASDSAVPSRCCMVPACATRRIRVCKGRSAICGRSPFYVFDQLYITFLIFFLSMSVKLKLSRAFNSPGRANLGRRLSLRWLCLDEMFHDRFRAKRRRYFFGEKWMWVMEVVCGDQSCVVLAMASSQRWDLALTPSLQGEARSWLLRYWPPLLCRSAVLASACDFESPRL